ncbi:S-adenosylmethionine:tRNA ribosyltransferase-isomerase [Geodia barretti]|uniref:S-adenosylmethionine:tRNA ribosyltransferase-isomerase n=3 Tax=Geodia barretti TaxID=519541 RepID=A0AA35RAJ1_GEOBA|nr:S-adenosylmethionine:tRNA ribosyltransferase-isomerase [Geodia barretti]
MRTDDFDYHLPPELIAQTPVEPRDSSRMLVLDRASGSVSHRQFSDILELIPPGAVLVLNRSRVIPARLYGRRKDTGGRVELLLLRREGEGIWQALGKPGRSLRPGVILAMGENESVEAEVLSIGEEGIRRIRLSAESGIDRLGEMPLPPYIHQRLSDPERYQTVYSRQPGSVAAPTAGLHFTPGLLDAMRDKGVETAFVTLHVGLDTFRPVSEDDPTEHAIHTEYYEMPEETAAALTRARAEGRSIIAVGTTSVRTLEQVGRDRAASGQADLFILPGHRFRLVDGMITNFHLPRSSLVMLVSAFAGRERILAAYREAIEERYRFYSFGDAMLIW